MIEFNTGGFRGVIGDDFTKDSCKRIAEALGRLADKETPVYVGYDYRFMSDIAAKWVAETLAAHDVPVMIATGPIPTPAVMYMVKTYKAHFGVMITSSHNPYFYNGVKVFEDEGVDASVPTTNKISKLANSIDAYAQGDYEASLSKGLIKEISFLNPYMDGIRPFLHRVEGKRPIKVLIDPIYGTGAITLSEALKIIGIKNYTMINGSHDALFGGKLPNPTKENMLKDAPLLLKGGYDVALGTDSDCDRLGVLDENGNYVDANEILAGIYYYLVKHRGLKGDVVKTIATSDLIDAMAKKLGFKAYEVDVGFKNVSAAMKEHDALIGGESSGGLTCRGYIHGKDSTFSSALFLEAVAYEGLPVSKFIKKIKSFAGFKSLFVEESMTFRNRNKIISALGKESPKFQKKPKSTQVMGRNYKYRFGATGDWALIRFSGTEPLVRFMAEAPKEETAKRYIDAMKAFVGDADSR